MKQQHIDEVRRLETQLGEVTPDMVISEAKKKGSPLHDYFEWDHTKAALAYWRSQARALIRQVKVVVEVEERFFTVPQYVRNPEREHQEQGYRNIEKLRTDDDIKREVIVREFAKAAAALRRARDLAAYFDIEEMVDDTLRSIEGLQRLEDQLQYRHAN